MVGGGGCGLGCEERDDDPTRTHCPGIYPFPPPRLTSFPREIFGSNQTIRPLTNKIPIT